MPDPRWTGIRAAQDEQVRLMQSELEVAGKRRRAALAELKEARESLDVLVAEAKQMSKETNLFTIVQVAQWADIARSKTYQS